VLTSTFPDTDGRRPRVAGAGFITLDVTLGASSELAYSGVGGSTGNVLSILAFFGWNSVPLVHLGRDRVGAAIHREFLQLGADMSHVRLERSLTSPLLYQFAAEPTESPRYSFACPVCGRSRRFSEDLVNCGGEEFARSAAASSVFFFDRVTPGTVSMAAAARTGGALVFFEPSSVPSNRELFEAAVRNAHVIKYSADRIREPFTELLSCGFIEIQTLGARGLRFRKHSLAPDWIDLPALNAGAIADTSGAGDWCTAGFLHTLFALGNGDDVHALTYNEIYQALRLGQAIAALSVGHVGARGLMRASTPDATLEMAQRKLTGTAYSDWVRPAQAQTTSGSVCCEDLTSRVRQLPVRPLPAF
jgi:fructokinase